ncbi:MAG TPA: TetR family transcriptional regulator [Acidimicrobiales bacterium]|nr:TetR family transcriptional regulator [Acidimicrobiales bacterium]
MSSSPPDLVAIDGRRLGVRAKATRRRLLDATTELLETEGILDLKVVDVARKVGTSPATFYQYFANVEEAVLALADEVGNEILDLVPLVDQPWRGTTALELARRLVDGFITMWDTHRAVLRTRNLAAQEGDVRFRQLRIEQLSNITDRLAARVAENKAAGRVAPEMSPYAAASSMVAMMERMAAYHYEIEGRGVSRMNMVETVARILCQTVTGRRP